jgi:hypothetical protein
MAASAAVATTTRPPSPVEAAMALMIASALSVYSSLVVVVVEQLYGGGVACGDGDETMEICSTCCGCGGSLETTLEPCEPSEMAASASNGCYSPSVI